MLRKTPGSQEVAATPQRAIHVNIWKTETSSQGVAPVSLVNLKTANCQALAIANCCVTPATMRRNNCHTAICQDTLAIANYCVTPATTVTLLTVGLL